MIREAGAPLSHDRLTGMCARTGVGTAVGRHGVDRYPFPLSFFPTMTHSQVVCGTRRKEAARLCRL